MSEKLSPLPQLTDASSLRPEDLTPSTEHFDDPVSEEDRGLEFMAAADLDLGIAAATEEVYGIEAAGAQYQIAMENYLDALFHHPTYATNMDSTFWLKLGGAQARVATWEDLEPYDNGNPLGGSRRGIDRREDLFESSERCYERAYKSAGGIEAPAEEMARICLERANMYALQATFRSAHGNRGVMANFHTALEIIGRAKDVIEHTTVDEVVSPELIDMIEKQDSEVRNAIKGEDTSELHIIAAESMQELVAIS